MRLGRVVGRVWSTAKIDQLEGCKLLIIQPITADGRDTGRRLIALDGVGAGSGETIYWCRGREASFAMLPADIGTDAAVVGVVDSIRTTVNSETVGAES
jgi:ethanolamine utilization protein EutN